VSAPPPETRKPLGAGGWLVLIPLIAMLVAAIVYAAQVWMSMDVEMSGAGRLFLILGIVVSIALGGGLMALVFYSSRKNYDR